jgi:hypothetical protein
MVAEEIARLPALPEAVAEWEDLLVRLEIMPRAVYGALEEPGASDDDRAAALAELLDRERKVGRWLEEAAFGSAESAATPDAPGADPRWLADRFAAVRARNFAMLQRRGVDVWAWAGNFDGTRVTVYQLLAGLLRCDAAVLAALRQREPLAGGVTAC